ncbi:unnamed protein product [Pleuronectes platessa]|uniref:Uncharacterized protein n=1 Tax=Pleuronectes platessa TaxID=8262 RepID=A0A9N7UIC1_PLEPL|nr:unnamed protein product [Pleuronectes platessa]
MNCKAHVHFYIFVQTRADKDKPLEVEHSGPLPLRPALSAAAGLARSSGLLCVALLSTSPKAHPIVCAGLMCLLQRLPPGPRQAGESSSEFSGLTCLPVSLHAVVLAAALRQGDTGREAGGQVETHEI